ncbi:MAG: Trp biosynthesis-associated membrane protein [Actinomycetales bacterium]|nr:Trp biosynthesis-associated membrane protein [Actinomycetales bacterium]
MTSPRAAFPASRTGVAVLVLAGVGLALLAAGRTWVTVPVHGVPGQTDLHVPGRSAAPGIVASTVVAVAAVAVLVVARRGVRALAAVVLLGCGGAVAVLALRVGLDPTSAVRAEVVRVTGVTGAGAADPVARSSGGPGGDGSVTGWPLVTVAGGLLVAAGGVLGAVRGRTWTPARRYEIGVPSAGAPPGPLDPRDAWDALSRGEDPTDGRRTRTDPTR